MKTAEIFIYDILKIKNVKNNPKSVPKKEVPVTNTKINTELMTSITYECIYPKILTLTSDSYEVANVIEERIKI